MIRSRAPIAAVRMRVAIEYRRMLPFSAREAKRGILIEIWIVKFDGANWKWWNVAQKRSVVGLFPRAHDFVIGHVGSSPF